MSTMTSLPAILWHVANHLSYQPGLGKVLTTKEGTAPFYYTIGSTPTGKIASTLSVQAHGAGNVLESLKILSASISVQMAILNVVTYDFITDLCTALDGITDGSPLTDERIKDMQEDRWLLAYVLVEYAIANPHLTTITDGITKVK